MTKSIVDYTIGSSNDLKKLSTIVKEGTNFSGKTILQVADLNLNGSSANQWEPIGQFENSFNGVFNGDLHKIDGLYIDSNSNQKALFGHTYQASIRNIILGTGKIRGSFAVAGVAGHSQESIISDCTNENTIIESTGQELTTIPINNIDVQISDSRTGGIVGNSNGGKILYSVNKARITGVYDAVGGIVGRSTNTYFEYNHNEGIVQGRSLAGGNIGFGLSVNINGASNNQTITGEYFVGGIVGYLGRSTTTQTDYSLLHQGLNLGKIINTGYTSVTFYGNNTNNVINDAGMAGGLIGGSAYSKIQYSCNKGTVEGKNQITGGIVGFAKASEIEGSYNEADIKNNAPQGIGTTGGVVGFAYNDSVNTNSNYTAGKINRCYNEGDITSTGNAVGGIAGKMTYNTLQNCYNMGKVSGKGNVGGILASAPYYGSNTEFIYSCYNVGMISASDSSAASIIRGPNNTGGSYLYALTGTSQSIVGITSTNPITNYSFLSDSIMKSSTLLNNLNVRNPGVWEKNSNINKGYPYLKNMPKW